MTTTSEAFLAAYTQWAEIPTMSQQLRDRAYNTLADEAIRAVKAMHPRKRSPAVTSEDPAERWLKVSKWAAAGLVPNFRLWIDQRMKPFQEEYEALDSERARLEGSLHDLALEAVFEREPGAANVVYVDTDHRNQSGPGFYQETACELRTEILRARGFEATVRRRETSGYEVVTDAPASIAHALRYWILDDVRMLRVVGVANLKVLLHPFFPYTGAWDWPEAKRTGRDHKSYAKHKKNEDAHLALNGGTP